MIYSRTTEYAIRALGVLASKPRDAFTGVREVSAESGVPYAYIAKIFTGLLRSGVLLSCHGRKGGFKLKRDPAGLSIMDIAKAVDSQERSPLSSCIMGLERCDDGKPCPLHPVWKQARKKIQDKMEDCTLSSIVKLNGLFPQGKRKSRTLSSAVRSVFKKRQEKK